jgi:hypothetical protein
LSVATEDYRPLIQRSIVVVIGGTKLLLLYDLLVDKGGMLEMSASVVI